MIPIQNIYYMLYYAFSVLREQRYVTIETEQFNNVADLYASILTKGIKQQIKRGLCKEYVSKTDSISSVKGKIDVSESIKKMTMMNNQMVCTYDEFTVNHRMNQIIKATCLELIRTDISKTWKKELRQLLVYFDDVQEINLNTVDWKFQYDKNNQTYKMLISICYLVSKGLLQSKNNGKTKVMDFTDEQRMCRLYEKFILEYYLKEHPEITTNASQISWQLDDDMDMFLPIMQTDITLEKGEKILIVDAKYYSKIMQNNYNKQTISSANLYQIFTYVKNKQVEIRDNTHKVSGMLLYVKTDEGLTIDNTYSMSGNKIAVRTLDLNCKFEKIKEQLDNIVFEYFEEYK